MSEYIYKKSGFPITIHNADTQFWADMHTINTFGTKALSEAEASHIAEDRLATRNKVLPGVIGEYAMIEGLNWEPRRPRAYAIMAHDYQNGMRDLVYVGCDGLEFAKSGNLFGKKSLREQLAVQESGQTYGLHRDNWQLAIGGRIEPLRYANEQRFGMVVGFEAECLYPIGSTKDSAMHWGVVPGETFESAARTIYVANHPARLGLLE
ncbi:MAG TPA: hypothetical protein PLT04_03125 [Candidatus Saccharibacteria bacterium]|nr:hypothetical protein [Candidatus Saccharibacteria bacterium]